MTRARHLFVCAAINGVVLAVCGLYWQHWQFYVATAWTLTLAAYFHRRGAVDERWRRRNREIVDRVIAEWGSGDDRPGT